MVRFSRVWRFTIRVVAASGLALIAASPGHAQLRPEPEALAAASPELVKRLQTCAFDYFRFVNRPWIAQVCEVFREDWRDFSNVRLHGDAHVEQFALTSDAWGLDDFDDSARGPALVDIVRFVGSIDLAARQRGWTRDRDALVDRFLKATATACHSRTFGLRSPTSSAASACRLRAHGRSFSRGEKGRWCL